MRWARDRFDRVAICTVKTRFDDVTSYVKYLQGTVHNTGRSFYVHVIKVHIAVLPYKLQLIFNFNA
jgi:hypothetical protein